jgi:hypothetical protein
MTHSTVSAPRPAVAPANNRFVVGILVGVVVSLGLVAIAVGSGIATRFAAVSAGPIESRPYAQTFDGAGSANVRLQFGSGNLTVGALDSAERNLASADFTGPSNFAPESTYRVRDGVGELAYTIHDIKFGLPVLRGDEATRMSVSLARNTPLALDMQGGAADSRIDLTQLQVTRLDLQTGVGNTRVRLPEAAGQTSVSVHGGITDLTFEVPQGVAADIHVSDAMASRQINEQRFRPIGGGHYRSTDYDTATNRVDMQVELGLATLRIP